MLPGFLIDLIVQGSPGRVLIFLMSNYEVFLELSLRDSGMTTMLRKRRWPGKKVGIQIEW